MRIGMKLNSVLIWGSLILCGAVQGYLLPDSKLAHIRLPWEIIFLPSIILLGAFLGEGFPAEESLRRVFDGQFGPGSFTALMVKYKPEFLFAAMFYPLGIVGLARTAQLGGPASSYHISGTFITAGFAFSLAYLIRHQRAQR